METRGEARSIRSTSLQPESGEGANTAPQFGELILDDRQTEIQVIRAAGAYSLPRQCVGEKYLGDGSSYATQRDTHIIAINNQRRPAARVVYTAKDIIAGASVQTGTIGREEDGTTLI